MHHHFKLINLINYIVFCFWNNLFFSWTNYTYLNYIYYILSICRLKIRVSFYRALKIVFQKGLKCIYDIRVSFQWARSFQVEKENGKKERAKERERERKGLIIGLVIYFTSGSPQITFAVCPSFSRRYYKSI